MKNPRPVCPNKACKNRTAPPAGFYWKRSHYRPKHNHQPVPRYQCKACGKGLGATQTKAIRHHKRPDLNQMVFKLAVPVATRVNTGEVIAFKVGRKPSSMKKGIIGNLGSPGPFLGLG